MEKITKQRLYNLDVIISIGYRVKSKRGVEFRQWANEILKQYILKGYVVNKKNVYKLLKKRLIFRQKCWQMHWM